MTRIQIKDLPLDMKLNEDAMKTLMGGTVSVAKCINLKYKKEGSWKGRSSKISGFFQGWQEKSNQVDQQLTSVLRIMRDLGRVGVSGSDLGAS